MFSKALLAQSRTFSVSLRAHASLSSLALLRHASSGKVLMPLQWQRALSTSLVLRDDESRFGGQNSRQRGFRRSVPPSGTLFIGNLPYAITEEELRECFASFGEIVRVSLGTTPEGMNRGFGHVQFATVDDACKVMKADEEDPIYVMNRDIYLDHAAVQEDTVREPYHTLFIRPFAGAEDNLREVFTNFEHSVVDVRILRDKATGESRGSGFVEFKDAEAATEALEALKDHRDPSTGRQMTIKFAKPARLDFKPDLRNKPNRNRQRFDRGDNGPRRKKLTWE